jgi:hypothetical protein
MAITPRPVKRARKTIPAPEPAVLDHRGKLMQKVLLRLPVEQCSRIDDYITQRPGKISRNTFILEAVEEKLKRAAR